MTERKAAVLGSPVAHSLSPVLHGAAYAALGLPWTYTRVECDAEALPGLVSGLGPEWVGLSVTMPGKHAALATASSATARAVAVGAANTLVRQQDGTWHADCTDVDGVTGALRANGYVPSTSDTAVVLGAGGTASAALAAFAAMGLASATIVVRDPARATSAIDCATRLGLPVEVLTWSTVDFAWLAARASLLVNTAPAAAVEPLAPDLAGCAHVLDVIYHPWPTPLAQAVDAKGGTLSTGLDMLLHQAFGQVELFTGRPAPRAEMRTALREATNSTIPLPL